MIFLVIAYISINLKLYNFSIHADKDRSAQIIIEHQDIFSESQLISMDEWDFDQETKASL